MTNKRYDFIDIAKGLGILSVVWAHILLVGWTHKIIYAFHMPLFFFISGFLFNENKYQSFSIFAKKRFCRLVIPYLIYSIVTWGIWAVFRYVRRDEVKSYLMPLLQTVIAQGSGSHLVHNSALWFIPCLLAVEFMYFHIRRLGETTAAIVCLGITGLGIVMAHCYGKAYLDNMPWNLDAAFLALPFYCVGHELRKSSEYLQRPYPLVARILFPVILWSALICLSLRHGECSMGSSSYQCHELIFILRAFIGIAALVGLALFLPRDMNWGTEYILDAIRWCGRHSLDIMCLHIPIKGVMIIIVAKLFKPRVDVAISLMYSFIAFAMTMGISFLLIFFIINPLKKKFKSFLS